MCRFTVLENFRTVLFTSTVVVAINVVRYKHTNDYSASTVESIHLLAEKNNFKLCVKMAACGAAERDINECPICMEDYTKPQLLTCNH